MKISLIYIWMFVTDNWTIIIVILWSKYLRDKQVIW
jgi:hypothetical protein